MENLTTAPEVEDPKIKQIKETLDLLWEAPILLRRLGARRPLGGRQTT